MRTSHRGMSLIEALISLLIVGIMAAGGLAAAGHAARMKTVGTDRVIGDRLATFMLDEVLSKQLIRRSMSPVNGRERSTFTCIDDYLGYRQSPPRDSAGVLMEADDWEWSVDIDRCDASGQSQTHGSMRRVTVRVSRDGATKATVSTVVGGAFAEVSP